LERVYRAVGWQRVEQIRYNNNNNNIIIINNNNNIINNNIVRIEINSVVRYAV
jgi:hypothetical protein